MSKLDATIKKTFERVEKELKEALKENKEIDFEEALSVIKKEFKDSYEDAYAEVFKGKNEDEIEEEKREFNIHIRSILLEMYLGLRRDLEILFVMMPYDKPGLSIYRFMNRIIEYIFELTM